LPEEALMRLSARQAAAALGAALALATAGQLAPRAQQPPGQAPTSFSFQVVQSFNARYLGDTPGHLGRGSLEGRTPDVSLGDPVYRVGTKVGTVTGLTWDRNKESLEVEFDPDEIETDPQGRPIRPVRIRIGQDLWIPLGGHPAPAPAR
jgi:hypothetical protein